MDITSIGTSLAIVTLCYLIGLGAKIVPFIKDEHIPVVVGVSGAILGVVGMYVIPEYPAQDVMTAMAVGVVSGLASTGINQVYKQLSNKQP